MRYRRWSDNDLIEAVLGPTSVRAVITKLGLVPAGGNYTQIQNRIHDLGLDINHFTGQGWNKGWLFDPRIPARSLHKVLVKDISIQSHQLKKRLFTAGLKQPSCELCGWAEISNDGRIPVELDHINGNPRDNRLENLRILCPNCHSLQPTHRGRNKKTRYARVL